MKRKNGKAIHGNALQPSPKSLVHGCQVVWEKVALVLTLHRRQRGMDLVPPPHLSNDWKFWRAMVKRYEKGDYRHTDAELQSMKMIAQWTLDVHCELRNQPKVHVDL